MRKLLTCLTLCVSFMMIQSSFAFADDPCLEDPRRCFDGFGDNDEIKPKDDRAKKTFDFPAIKAGFIVDIKDPDILPHLGIELVDFSLPKVGDFAVDVGVAPSIVFASLTWELLPVIKVGPSIWAGYNVKDSAPAFGIGITILDF